MSNEQPFQELLDQVRAGDDRAAVELLRRYEPVLRRIVRVRLTDARLRRLCDTSDICQSVLASFFVRAALGQYRLDGEEDLLRLLATMARNKLIDQARRLEREPPRDPRAPGADLPEDATTAPDPSPSEQVALPELLREARRRLSPDDRRLLELREQGLEWADIAVQVGGTPQALRKCLSRAVELVAQELGLDRE